MKTLLALATAAALALGAAAQAKDMSLAYWMGPKHPMNAGVFTPFADKLAAAVGWRTDRHHVPRRRAEHGPAQAVFDPA